MESKGSDVATIAMCLFGLYGDVLNVMALVRADESDFGTSCGTLIFILVPNCRISAVPFKMY